MNDSLIRGRCNKYIQTPDVFWNTLFTGQILESYDEWLASGVHYYTEAGNKKVA